MTTLAKSAPEITGNVSTDKKHNIYDLSGNVWKRAMEAS